MRLGWVEYVNPMVWRGGGELIMKALLDGAEASGTHVELFSVWPQVSFGNSDNVDCWVLVDVFNLPERQRRIDQRLARALPWTAAGRFSRILNHALSSAYVHIDNAYVDACSHPYLPCNGERAAAKCEAEQSGRFLAKSRRIYEGALANYCLSPLHGEVLGVLQPMMAGVRLIPPVVPAERFVAARRSSRDIEWLYAGALTEAKGSDRLQDVNPLVMVTSSTSGPRPAHACVVTGVPYDEMPNWFGRAKRFVYRPRWPEPFGRVVAEAALGGCDLLIEGRVGACSIDGDLSDPATYEAAVPRFWDDLKATFNGR